MLPFDTRGRAYGTIAVLYDGSLITYIHNVKDEKYVDYVISGDCGVTWGAVPRVFLEKQIRNPQMAVFVLHGLSGSKGDEVIKGHFVLYMSGDGITWDTGQFLRMRAPVKCFVSPTLLARLPSPRAQWMWHRPAATGPGPDLSQKLDAECVR